MSNLQLLTLMHEFAEAWNRHDVPALLGMCTDDGVFETAAGPEAFGSRHAGQAELREAFSAVFVNFPDASWNDAVHTCAGDRGFSEWTFRGTDRAGKKVEVRGVDLFVFRDGKIARKDTFRKTRTAST